MSASRRSAILVLAVASLILPAAAMSGCELIASVDRSLIPSDDASVTTDATTNDGAVGPDGSSNDATPIDASANDAPADVATDAPTEAGCSGPSGCPAPSNDCQSATCNTGVCGTSNKASEATCASNGGKVCDGNGACVKCVSDNDCPATGTICATPSCSSHACTTTNAAKGFPCSDHSGVVCDGSGSCVSQHCNDGVQDADETDMDCGGGSCAPCATSKKCKVGGDCKDKVCSGTPLTCQAATCTDGVQNGNETDKDCGGPQCDALSKTCAVGLGCGTATDCQSGYCQNNTTCALRPDGINCSANTQCFHGNCVGSICCDTPCSGTCQACTNALTAQPTGTCASMIAGSPAPAGQCTASPPCGNTGTCAASGACDQGASTVACGSASCSNGQLTPVGACSGTGTCNAGSPGSCPRGVKCADATSCLASCSGDGDCQSSNTYCSGVSCVAKGDPGATCAATNQCTSNVCGTSGTGTRCCTAACSASGACGATDCNGSGACVYPSGGVCAAASCAGNVLTSASTCNGAGTCSAGGQTTCAKGCFAGACNASDPSFAGDATASSSGGVTLDKEPNLNPSTGTAPANASVNVAMLTTPHGGLSALAMVYTTNDFATTTSVAMVLSSQSGANDTYAGSIPGQAAGTTVRFYFDGTDWSGAHIFNPGSFVNYTYVTQ